MPVVVVVVLTSAVAKAAVDEVVVAEATAVVVEDLAAEVSPTITNRYSLFPKTRDSVCITLKDKMIMKTYDLHTEHISHSTLKGCSTYTCTCIFYYNLTTKLCMISHSMEHNP